MKFETKAKKLGILNECENIIANCECGEITSARLVELSKTRKWEIMEIVGNYLDDDTQDHGDWWDIKRMDTFCKVFGINESEIADYYAQAISEGGYEIAYTINEDIILVLE